MAESYSNQKKTLWEKEKLLIASNFSFSPSVFKRLLSQGHQKVSFKPEENTVGKGEIAHCEQFLLFPQCFQKASFPGASKGVIAWEWVNRVYFLQFCTKYDT